MGLLDKALTIDSVAEGEKQPESLFSRDIEAILDSLARSGNGLDFPSRLFSAIAGQLEIRKGALLLPDDSGKFIPWSVVGLDQTTSRRIRIPESLPSSMNDPVVSPCRELNGVEVEQMKEYFSFREFSVTESILLATIEASGSAIALLLISESPVLSMDRSRRDELFRELSERAGALLLSRRDSIVSKLESYSSTGDDPSSVIGDFIDGGDRTPFLLLSVSIEGFISAISEKDPGALRYRIVEDILKLVNTLIGKRGRVVNMGNSSFLILLNSSRREEAEMFIHQIGLSLSFFFKIDSAYYNPSWHIISYPEDGSTADELLKHF